MIEILSTDRARDVLRKATKYAAAGLERYWIVDAAGVRWRLGFDWSFKRGMRLGARLAGLCFIDECETEFVMQSAAPTRNGLARGQFTFDELVCRSFQP